jgi:hypothetical protein
MREEELQKKSVRKIVEKIGYNQEERFYTEFATIFPTCAFFRIVVHIYHQFSITNSL